MRIQPVRTEDAKSTTAVVRSVAPTTKNKFTNFLMQHWNDLL